MRQKLLWLLCLVVFMVAGCNENKMTTWWMTGQDTDLVGRVGYDLDGIEVGATGKWHPSSEIDWGPEPDAVGAYMIIEASWEVRAEDTLEPAPPPVGWLDDFEVVPYGGLELIDDIDNGNFSNVQPNWIAGVKYKLGLEGAAAIVVEYVDGDQASGDVFVGGMVRF
ncbi:MAG: hypothetical protein ACYTE3_11935 [Planctomycetota bacterium]|jgi:hypothetical protein